MVLLTACGSTPSPASREAWPRATVEQPDAVTAEPSSTPAYCAPCHPAVITEMRDVAATVDGFVAVGSETPSTAVLWQSADGRSWHVADPPSTAEGARLEAIAAGDGTIVIVGSIGSAPAAWIGSAGAWTAASLPSGKGRMTGVVAGEDGFVAGGYIGPEFGGADAAIWRSGDGRSWQPVDLEDGDARITAVAVSGSRLVAVGTSGDDAAASWASSDGRQWERSASQPPLDDGAMLSVTANGDGWVAVGTSASGDEAVTWASPDGLHWTRAPDAPALHSNSTYAPHAEMSDVLVAGGRLVAVGWNSSPSNGSAVIWTSSDGITWTREPDEPSLSGGGMAAATTATKTRAQAEAGTTDEVVVAVGSTGWPDTHAATAWRHAVE